MTLEKLSFDSIQIPDEERMAKASEEYYRRHIFCPFLDNNLCHIYEVRPYSCVGYYVTTPIGYCDPDYLGEVPVERLIPNIEVTNTAFYFRMLDRPILLCMQKAVYGILERGYFYLSTIPGLEGIEVQAIHDKKIRSEYERYIRPDVML